MLILSFLSIWLNIIIRWTRMCGGSGICYALRYEQTFTTFAQVNMSRKCMLYDMKIFGYQKRALHRNVCIWKASHALEWSITMKRVTLSGLQGEWAEELRVEEWKNEIFNQQFYRCQCFLYKHNPIHIAHSLLFYVEYWGIALLFFSFRFIWSTRYNMQIYFIHRILFQ